MSESPEQFSKDPEAAKVLRLLEAGLWRKARDAAKELCRKDRGRYLVLLIRANVGLVREMLAKGLLKEAETVAAYLETFAPADTMAVLRAEMAAPTGKRQVAALADAGGAGWWASALRADEILAKAGSVSPADQAAIDLLVTDTYEPDVAGNDGQAARLAAELKAVRAACAATGEGRWEEAKHMLRDLPRQSVFWQWRIFLRGVRCVFEDERETARQCFAQLPQTGALARAAASLTPDPIQGAHPAPATTTVPFYLAATGQPAAWTAAILAAAASWKAGKRVQAFDDLVAGMKNAFPAVEPGLPALLTDAVMPSHARMGGDDWNDSEKLYHRFCSGRAKVNANFSRSALAFLRSMCVAERHEMPHQELERCWRLLIEIWQRCHGPDRLRDSLAWQWLGDALANPAEVNTPFGDAAENRRNAAKAIKAYEKSIDAEETNEAAWLGLVTLLIRQGDTKRSNKMLDDLVKKFPRNKGILVLSGDRAIGRKSYVKGIAILRTALDLDPLDKGLKERIVVALTLRVREASRKGAPTADLWAEIEPLLESAPPRGHYMLSRWMARVRRSLLDKAPEAAAQAEAESIAMAPSSLVRLFFSLSLASVYGIPPRQEWMHSWPHAASSTECTWKSLLEILRILDFTTAISGWAWKQTISASDRVLEVVGNLVAPGGLKEDPAGLLGAIDELDALRKRASQPGRHVIDLVIRDIADALGQHVSPGAKKTDPHLRLASLLTGYREVRETLKYLKTIIADAEAAGLPSVAARARAFQKKIESGNFRQPLDFLDEDDEDDAWDDDEDDIWDDEDDDDEPSDNAALPPEEFMEDLGRAIARGDAAAVSRIRNSLLKMGVTQKAIDMAIRLLTEAKGTSQSRETGATQKTAKKAAKKSTRKTGDDPRQIELF